MQRMMRQKGVKNFLSEWENLENVWVLGIHKKEEEEKEEERQRRKR